jgi:hypothetical protein
MQCSGRPIPCCAAGAPGDDRAAARCGGRRAAARGAARPGRARAAGGWGPRRSRERLLQDRPQQARIFPLALPSYALLPEHFAPGNPSPLLFTTAGHTPLAWCHASQHSMGVPRMGLLSCVRGIIPDLDKDKCCAPTLGGVILCLICAGAARRRWRRWARRGVRCGRSWS